MPVTASSRFNKLFRTLFDDVRSNKKLPENKRKEILQSLDTIQTLFNERDSKAAERGALLVDICNTLVRVKNGLVDEGDRCYFGSTNDCDELIAVYDRLDHWHSNVYYNKERL
ncbi:MAG TPA: hypothetical protein PK745_00170 [bacterium]|nr:hypothetical protein [bacterium]